MTALVLGVTAQTVNARKLGAILNGRLHATLKPKLLMRFRRVVLTAWACGESKPTAGEALQLEQLTGGFLPREGWRC